MVGFPWTLLGPPLTNFYGRLNGCPAVFPSLGVSGPGTGLRVFARGNTWGDPNIQYPTLPGMPFELLISGSHARLCGVGRNWDVFPRPNTEDVPKPAS
jgi:hypothetical protein